MARKIKHILCKLVGFLIGHEPAIFNSAGKVEHPMDAEKLKAWQETYEYGSEYNWEAHKGTYQDPG